MLRRSLDASTQRRVPSHRDLPRAALWQCFGCWLSPVSSGAERVALGRRQSHRWAEGAGEAAEPASVVMAEPPAWSPPGIWGPLWLLEAMLKLVFAV